MANAIAVSKRDIEGMTPLVASRHHDLMKENPAAGELWRGGVSKMKARPLRMLASGVCSFDALFHSSSDALATASQCQPSKSNSRSA